MSIQNGTAAQTWKHVQNSVGFTVTTAQAQTAGQVPLPHGGLVVQPKRQGRRFFVGDRGSTPSTGQRRIPDIDVKLGKLHDQCKHISIEGLNFWHVHGDVAVDVLGFYNPIYAGRPKKLAQMLLDILPGHKRREWSLIGSGLAYPVPGLAGIRAERMRLSAAGLALLDHWAKTFPKFAEFLAPYDSKKARKTILTHCYDLAIGHRPSDFKKIDEANVVNQLKCDSRELKRLKQEQERAKLAKDIQYQRLLDVQYQRAINNGSWASTSGSATIPLTAGGTGVTPRNNLGMKGPWQV